MDYIATYDAAVQAGLPSFEHDALVDAVVSRHVLHRLTDFWKALALARIAQLLRLGGVFLLRDIVYAIDPHDAERAIDAWLSGAPDDPARGWTSANGIHASYTCVRG